MAALKDCCAVLLKKRTKILRSRQYQILYTSTRQKKTSHIGQIDDRSLLTIQICQGRLIHLSICMIRSTSSFVHAAGVEAVIWMIYYYYHICIIIVVDMFPGVGLYYCTSEAELYRFCTTSPITARQDLLVDDLLPYPGTSIHMIHGPLVMCSVYDEQHTCAI